MIIDTTCKFCGNNIKIDEDKPRFCQGCIDSIFDNLLKRMEGRK